MKLDNCLAHLHPHLHSPALSALFPEVTNEGSIRIDASCGRWTTAPLGALPAVHSPRRPRAIACMASPQVLCALVKAISSLTQVVDLYLDIRLQIHHTRQRRPSSREEEQFRTSPRSPQPGLELDPLARVAHHISEIPSVKRLSLGGAFRSGRVLAAVATLLPTTLSSLEYITVLPGDSGLAPGFSEGLVCCTGLKVLRIDGCHELQRGADSLAASIAKLSALECIELRSRAIKHKAFDSLVQQLPYQEGEQSVCMPHLQQVTIEKCWGCAHAQALSSWLQRIPHLLHLTLSNSRLAPTDAEVLSEALSCLTALRSLNLSGNSNLGISVGCRNVAEDVSRFNGLVQACASIKTLVRTRTKF